MIRKLLTLLPPVSLKITDTLYSVVVSIRMQIVFFRSLIATLFSKIWSISVNLSSGHFPHDGMVAKSQGKTFESGKVCTDLWSSQGKVQSQLNLVQSLFLMNDCHFLQLILFPVVKQVRLGLWMKFCPIITFISNFNIYGTFPCMKWRMIPF